MPDITKRLGTTKVDIVDKAVDRKPFMHKVRYN